MQSGTPRVLGDRYELRALLASGGMGQVWRAHDRLLQRTVAVKVLRSEYAGDPVFLARFRAEATHAALLQHPHVAAVYDYGETTVAHLGDEHVAYLVMELVEGESLAALLSREGRLDPDRALGVLRQAAAALGAAHRAGIVHRDVKPGNLLVGWDGTVKVTDFGIAWSAASVALTQTGQVIGTAHYLSPEQAAGTRATAASDVYGLGMVGYEVLSGRRAFEGESSVAVALRQLRDEPDPLPGTVPAGVRALIAAMTVKDPAGRLPDGDAVVGAIDRVPDASPVVAAAEPTRLITAADRPTGAWGLDGWVGATGSRTDAAVRRGRTARRALLLAPLVVLVLGAAVAGLLFSGLLTEPGSPPASAADPTSTSAASPTAVVLDPAAYPGRPVAEVQAELTALGLTVTTVPVETADTTPGLVTAVSPSGAPLPAGSAVEVRYTVAPAPAETTAAAEPAAPAASPAAPPSGPAPAPTPAAPAAPTTAAGSSEGDGGDEADEADEEGQEGRDGNGGGNGNGNGSGNGNGNGNGGGRNGD